MGFFKRLFGGDDKPDESASEKLVRLEGSGIFIYPECERCKTRLRLRADKEYDLQTESFGYAWHKTLVCHKCFQRMPTVVYFDNKLNVTGTEIDGGRYLTVGEFERLEAEAVAAKEAAERAAAEAKLAEAAELAAEEEDSAESPTDNSDDSARGFA